jgi:hypothetical protein
MKTCEVCGTEEATTIMRKAWTDDEGRSSGESDTHKNMCADCAEIAKEAGEYEEA